jgi:hypothetical protein
VWQNGMLQYGRHPGIGALRQETANRFFESAMQRELSPEDLVLTKEHKEDAYNDA